MKALSFTTFVVAMAAAPAVADETHKEYQPIQAISHDLGSKALSGYYVKHGRVCLVTLMISEKGDLDNPSPTTAARVRMLLDPGEI